MPRALGERQWLRDSDKNSVRNLVIENVDAMVKCLSSTEEGHDVLLCLLNEIYNERGFVFDREIAGPGDGMPDWICRVEVGYGDDFKTQTIIDSDLVSILGRAQIVQDVIRQSLGVESEESEESDGSDGSEDEEAIDCDDPEGDDEDDEAELSLASWAMGARDLLEKGVSALTAIEQNTSKAANELSKLNKFLSCKEED